MLGILQDQHNTSPFLNKIHQKVTVQLPINDSHIPFLSFHIDYITILHFTIQIQGTLNTDLRAVFISTFFREQLQDSYSCIQS